MSTTTWNKMQKNGWTLDDINQSQADFGLTFVRFEHATRTMVGYTADYLIYVDADGDESQWCCERLHCPVHKVNTTAFGEGSGLGAYDGACGCNFLYEDWQEPK